MRDYSEAVVGFRKAENTVIFVCNSITYLPTELAVKHSREYPCSSPGFSSEEQSGPDHSNVDI